MKRNFLALAFILVLFLGIYYVKHAYRSFNWDDASTYLNHHSDEPLGCQIFDSIAKQTALHGYRYEDVAFDRVEQMKQPLSLLCISNGFYMDSPLCARLFSFVKKGNNVMIVTSNLWIPSDRDEHLDSIDYGKKAPLNFDAYISDISRFDIDSLKMAFKKGQKMVVDTEEGTVLHPQRYEVNPWLLSDYIVHAADWQELLGAHFKVNRTVEDDDVEGGYRIELIEERECVAVVRMLGKGMLFLVSTPYLFTNYAALDPQLCHYQNRLLSLIENHPIVCVDRIYSEVEDDYSDLTLGESPLDFFLKHPPMRWALYTAVVALLLFMFFTARRRQRIIPYKEPPSNRSLEFVRLLGTIYFQQHDRNDLLRKKYTYFSEELRRCQLIDLGDRDQEKELIALLARTADVPVNQVERVMRHIWVYIDGEEVPDNKTLCGCLDDMNYLLSRCRQSVR
jgi:hypothetical protein